MPPDYEGAMDNDDLLIISPAIGIAARFLFTLIFFLSGITHFTSMKSYIDLVIPWRAFWVIISALFEFAGAVMILFNWKPRLGGWLIVIFLVPVTIVVHGTGIFSHDPLMSAVNVSMFLKGLAMIGCALFVTQFGVRVPSTGLPW